MFKTFFTFLVGLVGSLLGLVTSAHAALPADVSTALTDMKADTMSVAGAFVVLAILVAAFMWMRKPAK